MRNILIAFHSNGLKVVQEDWTDWSWLSPSSLLQDTVMSTEMVSSSSVVVSSVSGSSSSGMAERRRRSPISTFISFSSRIDGRSRDVSAITSSCEWLTATRDGDEIRIDDIIGTAAATEDGNWWRRWSKVMTKSIQQKTKDIVNKTNEVPLMYRPWSNWRAQRTGTIPVIIGHSMANATVELSPIKPYTTRRGVT